MSKPVLPTALSLPVQSFDADTLLPLGARQAEPLHGELVSTTLRDILTREGIPQPLPNNWLEEWLAELFSVSPGTADVIGEVALGLAMAVLLAALTILLLRLWRRSQVPLRAGAGQEASPAEQLRDHVADLRKRARAAEERGDWVLALRLEFFALAVGLGESGALEYRDAWTNRELLERGHPRQEVRARLLPILGDLDAKTFGGAACNRDDVRHLAQITDSLLTGGLT
ncbi:MAG: hypothetical protein QF724_05240 [Planctomycetota bacterium]|jgi:hypothetical protein|nr:hypothetical protein [Planctomycetota bacterium]